jgi:hypothetical protein
VSALNSFSDETKNLWSQTQCPTSSDTANPEYRQSSHSQGLPTAIFSPPQEKVFAFEPHVVLATLTEICVADCSPKGISPTSRDSLDSLKVIFLLQEKRRGIMKVLSSRVVGSDYTDHKSLHHGQFSEQI